MSISKYKFYFIFYGCYVIITVKAGDNMGVVGRNIKRIRKEKGITQKELGKMLNISQAAIGQFESNKSNPKIETLEKIADCLSVPVAELLFAENDSVYDEMTPEELELSHEIHGVSLTEGPILEVIGSFMKLNEKGQQKVADYAKDLCSVKDYLKKYWQAKTTDDK